VLFEPIVFPQVRDLPEGGSPMPAAARRRRPEFASYDEAIANFASKPPLNTLRADALAAYVRHGFALTDAGNVRLKCQPENEARTYEMSGTHGTFERLDEIACPVLVLSGRDEPMQPAAWAEQVADAMPSGRFERHDELGHFGPLEAPDLVADVIAGFFSSLP
jgi:pimeloyl-ACP methyl ester carboxylesterase